MAFDNLRLDKGLYASPKGFTASLEAADPSENYKGTALEGLDAYQRQLKRFGIKVSGAGSDSVSKFFQTGDSAVLFPEYVSRAVQQGMEDADLLSQIIATTTQVDSLDYRSVESVPADEEKELAAVGEGAFIPETTIRAKDKLTRLHKRGRMLVASYEAIKFQKLDLFTVTLRQIGAYIARSQFADAIDVLLDGSSETLESAGSAVSYQDLIDMWAGLSPYRMTTVIAGVPSISALLNMEQFSDSAAGQDFHGTGRMITPLGAQVVRCDKLGGEKLIALDKSAALEKVCAGGVATEYDKLIDRQLERATVTAITGFSKIFPDACKIMQIGE